MTVVSRWLVIPIPLIWLGLMPESIKALAIVDETAFQISLALCSTHPGLGKYCVNSRCASATLRPA